MEQDKKEDDEISIDLSKLVNFFKGKKTKESRPENKAEDNPSKEELKEDIQEKADIKDEEKEDISIDLGKIKRSVKGIFSGKKAKAEEKEDQEIAIDWKKPLEFIKKNRILLLILIPLILSIYLRAMPAYLPITDEWAENSIQQQIRAGITDSINQQYPNLPQANKQALVERELEKAMETGEEEIKQQTGQLSSYFKSRLQDDSGQTYLLAIDPWFWMRFAGNIVEKGHAADEFREGKPIDNHMFAPGGRVITPDLFHAYFEAYLFRFFHFFNRDIEIMQVVFYVPVLLASLAVIPAFFIAKRFGGNIGGFIAAFIVAINPSFISRTAGGFADTDPYNVLFPLLITWIFLEAFNSKNIKNRLMLGSLAGFLVGLYAFTWSGWWYIFDFLVASSAIYLAYFVIVHRADIKKDISGFIRKPQIKNTAILLLVFIVSVSVFVTAFQSFTTLKQGILQGPTGFVRLKDISQVWPNVFTTVAEQNAASLNQVIASMGGNFLFFLGLLGLYLTLSSKGRKNWWFLFLAAVWYLLVLFAIKPSDIEVFLLLVSIPLVIKYAHGMMKKDTSIDIKYASLLILWFASTTLASTKGIRFSLLLVPAFGISLGIALGFIYKEMSSFIIKELKINSTIVKAAVIILLLFLFIGPWKSAHATARNEIPSVNDAWYDSLQKIKLESEPDAIVNSWWDFGHWFKYIADRAVTFDGTSQNSPQAHWIGKVLLTDDEKTAAGILRMLDCSGFQGNGGSKAVDELDKLTKDTPKTIDLINRIIVEDKEKAEEILISEGIDQDKADLILSYSHCDPPENYFITSDDMVGKSGVWAHFGSWDFKKALMYNKIRKPGFKNDRREYIGWLMQRFNYPEGKATDMYGEVSSINNNDEANSWIASWPSYIGTGGCQEVQEKLLRCDLIQGASAFINLSDMNVDIPTAQGMLHPDNLAFVEGKDISVKQFRNSTIGFGIALVPEAASYQVVMASPELTGSMFTRLYYFQGHGLSYFKPFSYKQSFNGNHIYVWDVDWEGKEKNVVEEFMPSDKIEENTESKDNSSIDFNGSS